jgi:hypothetical protein
MKKSFPLIFILLICNSTFGQEKEDSFWKPYVLSDIKQLRLVSFDSIKYEKAYRIWNPHQVIELIKINDSTYNGKMVNFATKTTPDENKIGKISQTLMIPDYTVKKLINKLFTENIETLPDSYDVKGYINGVDGITYIFEIGTSIGCRIYSYWEPENDHYQNPELKEIKNVRNILSSIRSEIDLNGLFTKFTDNLGRGTYDIGGIILTIK